MNGDGFWAGVTVATVTILDASGRKYRDACLQMRACVGMAKDSNGGKLP